MPSPRSTRTIWFAPLAALFVSGLFLAVPSAHAQGDLAVRWSGCAPNGAINFEPAAQCAVGVSEQRLVLSLSPATELTDVVGWTLVMDFASDAATLPPWWQVQPGGCRNTIPNQMVAVMPLGNEDCVDLWSASGSALVQSYLYPRPGGDVRQFRLILGVGVSAPQAFSMTAGERYLGAILSIRFAMTTSGECPGCTAPVCFVFNSAEIHRVPGAPGGDPEPFVTPSPDWGNQATWAGGTGCASVPARGRSWGQIKTLYR
jgi:hypothetical protein